MKENPKGARDFHVTIKSKVIQKKRDSNVTIQCKVILKVREILRKNQMKENPRAARDAIVIIQCKRNALKILT